MKGIKALNDLARTHVGDHKRPALYFVTDGGNVVTITTSRTLAYKHWRELADRRPLQECALEDRCTGVLASVEPEIDAPGARLRIYDDYQGLLS